MLQCCVVQGNTKVVRSEFVLNCKLVRSPEAAWRQGQKQGKLF